MSSYYKKINGKNYDKAMLEIADKSISGKGDGRISLADSKNIVKAFKDGGKITDIERRTLEYILEKYKLTETALKHIEKSLSDSADTVENTVAEPVETPKKKLSGKIETSEFTEQKPVKKSRKWLLILFLIVIILVFAVLIFLKYFYKKAVSVNNITEAKTEVLNDKKTENISDGTIQTTDKTSVKSVSDHEYIVKDKDSLIKISETLYGDFRKWEEIYKLNNKVISNPTILYPGQVLALPDKNEKK